MPGLVPRILGWSVCTSGELISSCEVRSIQDDSLISSFLSRGLGFKLNLWLVVAALAAHSIFDFFHRFLFVNPGVPVWWPPFCLTYDLVAAGYLAWLLAGGKLAAKAR